MKIIKTKNKYIAPIVGWVSFFPFVVLAQTQTLETTFTNIQNILKAIIPLLMVIATIVFLWGVIVYITAAGDEEKIKKGRTYIIYGLIGLFAMVAVWGIVSIFVSFFGVGGEEIPKGPGFERPS